MKIVDILIDSAYLLGLTDEVEILDGASVEAEAQILEDNKNIKSLFSLVKFSIRELCTNYAPMISSVKITTTNCSYAISDIENCIRVQNISKDGNMVKFKTINRNLIFDKDGEFVINYLTYPSIKSLFEEIDFLSELSPDVLVLGLCAYYALAHGMFDEFHDFHEKYISRAQSLKVLRGFQMPVRRWEWKQKKLLT